jgi:DNA-directed RNA polymerase subunit M/transcription elongation factor TFIIS
MQIQASQDSFGEKGKQITDYIVAMSHKHLMQEKGNDRDKFLNSLLKKFQQQGNFSAIERDQYALYIVNNPRHNEEENMTTVSITVITVIRKQLLSYQFGHKYEDEQTITEFLDFTKQYARKLVEINRRGFANGLYDGLFSPFKLIASFFFPVELLAHDNTGWKYWIGFIWGILCVWSAINEPNRRAKMIQTQIDEAQTNVASNITVDYMTIDPPVQKEGKCPRCGKIVDYTESKGWNSKNGVNRTYCYRCDDCSYEWQESC